MKKAVITGLSVLLVLLMLIAMPVSAEAEGRPPEAESLEARVRPGSGLIGRLSAADPDGDLAGYTVTTKPVRGELLVKEDGRFLYIPHISRGGWDYFGYRAFDAEGQFSQEATVIIKIEKSK